MNLILMENLTQYTLEFLSQERNICSSQPTARCQNLNFSWRKTFSELLAYFTQVCRLCSPAAAVAAAQWRFGVVNNKEFTMQVKVQKNITQELANFKVTFFFLNRKSRPKEKKMFPSKVFCLVFIYSFWSVSLFLSKKTQNRLW